jgi:DNA adenine methylase
MNSKKIYVPPIKSQGIKSKLVPWINSIVPSKISGKWVEPFMGTGVVAFNVVPDNALLCDANPHLIEFYKSIQNESITPKKALSFLRDEGEILRKVGEEHFYTIRERFNKNGDPLDFLFLNRSCFNGMIRFNKKGGFNVPFCRKTERFAQAYVTKIINQLTYVSLLLKRKNYIFKCQDFKKTIAEAEYNDWLYCDPPYIDRHADYYNGWGESSENELFSELSKFKGHFILSTWHHNDFRKNDYIEKLWSKFHIITRDHFYHVGGSELNRNPMVEALITNYVTKINEKFIVRPEQMVLFERALNYSITEAI